MGTNDIQYGKRIRPETATDVIMLKVQQAGGTTFQWDPNGNMIQRNDGSTTRNMCWDEENRLVAVHDDGSIPMLSSYIYDAGGERVWKLSNHETTLKLRGKSVHTSMDLNKTLYISPLMVMTDKEYTKHYFIEGERVCTKVGGGFRFANTDPDWQALHFINGDETTVSTDVGAMVLRGVNCSGYNVALVEIGPTLRPATKDNSRKERQQYFYHPDHLSSSSFITDAAGVAEEHLQYLPFGEIFVQQQNSNYDTRYKFSAKELDPETNYTYFGARYYDSDLSVFLSIDRFAYKYPSLSPYHYTANNPVNFTDVNGDTIRIKFGGFLGIGRKTATYQDGKFYDSKGNEIDSKNKFYNAVSSAINELNSGTEGQKEVKELAESEHDFIFVRQPGLLDYGLFTPFSDKNSTIAGVGSGGKFYISLRQIDPMYITLAHEMGHAIASNRGITNNTIWGYVGKYSFCYDEQIAMHYENLIRAEHGLPLRRFYDNNRGRAVKGIDESTYIPGYHYYKGKMKVPSIITNFLNRSLKL